MRLRTSSGTRTERKAMPFITHMHTNKLVHKYPGVALFARRWRCSGRPRLAAAITANPKRETSAGRLRRERAPVHGCRHHHPEFAKPMKEDALPSAAGRVSVDPARLLDEGADPGGFLKPCGYPGGAGHSLDRHGWLLVRSLRTPVSHASHESNGIVFRRRRHSLMVC